MIVDLYDAIDRMLWAVFAWIVIAAVVAAPVALGVAAGLTWAVKRAWRSLSGPCGASEGAEVARDVPEAPEASQGPRSDSGYREAA